MTIEEMNKLIEDYEKEYGSGWRIKRKPKPKKNNPVFTEYLPGEIKEV